MIVIPSCPGYALHPATDQRVCPPSRSSLIYMMQAAENRKGDDVGGPAVAETAALLELWNLLTDTLVRARAIEVRHVLLEDTPQVFALTITI